MISFSTQISIKTLSGKLDNILHDAIDRSKPQSFVPGVVGGVTNEKETVYLKAEGVENLNTTKPMTDDSIFCYYSCTKAITTTAILQLWEKGLIDLDIPVKTYLPKIGKVRIIKELEDGKKPVTESAKADITMRMLLTHTAGFSYAFFNDNYNRLLKLSGQPNILSVDENTMDHTFLTYEPGTKWHYGMNLDWAGFVLEAITGKSLGEYITENIFIPANMKSCTFHLGSDKDAVAAHIRTSNGLSVAPFGPDKSPKLDMGGHGVFGTVDDYLKFIRIWLNEGTTSEGVQIIKHETYQLAIQNNLPEGLHITNLESYDARITKSVDIDPELEPDTWCLGFAVSENDLPTGRPKGCLYWSGVANLYYLIDIKNKIGIFWASQIFPFLDASADRFVGMESAVYDTLHSSTI